MAIEGHLSPPQVGLFAFKFIRTTSGDEAFVPGTTCPTSVFHSLWLRL